MKYVIEFIYDGQPVSIADDGRWIIPVHQGCRFMSRESAQAFIDHNSDIFPTDSHPRPIED